MPAEHDAKRQPARDGGPYDGVRRRLSEYHAKRDFTRTAEPAGGVDLARTDRARFVVQRHRARRLHYDLRLEVDGVLASWAVPKGPSLDPDVKRLAVHVEDHPLEYLDFEGVIPEGEYGGGDVIVWDRGTYEPAHTDDTAGAIAGGSLHVDLDGEKLRGRFVLIRRGHDTSGKEQWLLFHKHDEFAQHGWDAEDHPESVRSGLTDDQVAARPEAMGRSDLPAERASVDFSASRTDFAALDRLGNTGDWEFDGVTLRLTNLDKVLVPGRAGGPPLTRRDLVRYYAAVAPVMLPYLEARPLNMHRFPDGVDRGGFWHKEVPDHAPDWITRWHNDDADDGETEWYLVADRPATLAWLANFGAAELHAWTSRVTDVHRPTYALVDIDPGEKTTWADVVLLTTLHRTALEHLHVRGQPKVSGRRGIQIWIPIEPGPTFDDTRGWVEELSRVIGRMVPELVSWKWEKRSRGGPARLDFTQNAINKTLVAPYSVRGARRAGVVADPVGRDRRSGAARRPVDGSRRGRAAPRGRRPVDHRARWRPASSPPRIGWSG